MKNIKLFEQFINEASYKDLNNFFNDLLRAFDLPWEGGKGKKKSSAKNHSSGILLDVTGGFGWKQETISIELADLPEEVKQSEEDCLKIINGIYSKYKDTITKKRTKDEGFLAFTYKK